MSDGSWQILCASDGATIARIDETTAIYYPNHDDSHAKLLREAIGTLVEKWGKAKDLPHIRRPVSFALYETWREIEQQEEDRKK